MKSNNINIEILGSNNNSNLVLESINSNIGTKDKINKKLSSYKNLEFYSRSSGNSIEWNKIMDLDKDKVENLLLNLQYIEILYDEKIFDDSLNIFSNKIKKDDLKDTNKWDYELMDKKELKIYILQDESFFNNPSNYNSEKYRSTGVYNGDLFIEKFTNGQDELIQPFKFFFEQSINHPTRKEWLQYIPPPINDSNLLNNYAESDEINSTTIPKNYDTFEELFKNHPIEPAIPGKSYFTFSYASPKNYKLNELIQIVDYIILFDVFEDIIRFFNYRIKHIQNRDPKLRNLEANNELRRFQYGNEIAIKLPNGKGIYVQRWRYYLSSFNFNK